VGDRGFALASRGRSIFVSAPSTTLPAAGGGREVRVIGELSALSRYRAARLREALSPALSRDVPHAVGDPFVLLRTVVPASGD
jgi:hypothetical protein